VTDPSGEATSSGLSPIQQVYDRYVSTEKLKHGTKYEQLAALVFQVLEVDSSITHNVRLRGDGKETVHQIDVLLTRGSIATRAIIECRDKVEGNLVALDEARSFATVARQLNADGIIVTTTDFTQGAQSLARDEGLKLFTLRPFLPADQEGRLTRINVQMRVVQPTPVDVRVSSPPESDIAPGNVPVEMDSAITSGSDAQTLRHLLAEQMDAPLEGEVPVGLQTSTRTFTPPVTVDVNGRVLKIDRLEVDYRIGVATHEFTIDAGERVAELILKPLDGSRDRVIWNNELRRYEVVRPSGLVTRRDP
jgi:hypothetical protein